MGPGSNIQGGGADSVTLCNIEMGGDRRYAQGPDSVPPSGGATDHGYDGETWGRQRVGVSIGRGGDVLRGDPTHRSIHQETADKHIIEGGLPACLWNPLRLCAQCIVSPVGLPL